MASKPELCTSSSRSFRDREISKKFGECRDTFCLVADNVLIAGKVTGKYTGKIENMQLHLVKMRADTSPFKSVSSQPVMIFWIPASFSKGGKK